MENREYISKTGDLAEQLIGKTITHISGFEYSFWITFDDGSILSISGQDYTDSRLKVLFNQADENSSTAATARAR